MKRNKITRSLLGAGLLVVVWGGVAFAEDPLSEPPAWSTVRTQLPSALSQLPAVNDRGQDIIRQTPTLSGRLQVSEHTVKKYLFRIFEKLGISTRVELVLYALNHGDHRSAEWLPGTN